MLTITSPAFGDGGPIPRAHTCDGADISPPLVWTDVPAEAQSLALIMDDPDAPSGTFVHWVAYGLPAAQTSLPAGVTPEPEVTKPIPFKQGTTSFRRVGYGGPCPPPGPAHRYFVKLYAVLGELSLPPGATKDVLLAAMKGKVVAEAMVMGKYGRT